MWKGFYMDFYNKTFILILVLFIIATGTLLPLNNNNAYDSASETSLEAGASKDGEYIIKWKSSYQEGSIKQAEILDWDEQLGVTLIKLNKNVDKTKWLRELQANPNIEYIQPNYVYKISQKPNDPQYNQQSYLKQIKAETAWDTVNKSELTIAILDTGVDLSHPDLKDNLIQGINLLDREKPPQDGNGHGTNVAGIVAAVGNNGIGISGTVWKTKIMPIKVLDDQDGEGKSFIVGQGIKYAADNGAKIILLSAGEPIYTPFMYEAVNYAESKGALIVAASGNDSNRLNYPAALPNVISVGAVDSFDRYVSYSNYGQQLDVVAPGERIYTTKLGGDYTINSGTSMAAPQVAGLAALILQLRPNLTPREVANIIKFSADDVGEPGWDIYTGFGRINFAKAISMPLSSLIDGYEPNQTSSTAHMFPLEDIFNAQLDQFDVDWYKLDLPYNGTITLTLKLERALEYGVLLDIVSPENIIKVPTIPPADDIDNPLNSPQREDLFFQSRAESYEPIASQLVNQEQIIKIELPKGITYLNLRLAPEETTLGAKKINYQLSNSYQIYHDKYESNDNPWQAYLIKNINETIIGTLSKDFDEDWYKIQVLKPGTLTATVTVDTLRLDPILTLQPLGGYGREFDYNNAGKEEFGYLNVIPGSYYIKVSDYNGYMVQGEYQLQLRFKAKDNDFNEPNDLSSEATPLDLTERIYRGINTDDLDYDWFSFEIFEPSYIAANFVADKNIELALYDRKLNVMYTVNDLFWNFNDVLAEGKYYLRTYSLEAENSYSFQLNKKELFGNFIDIGEHWAREQIVLLYEEQIISDSEDYLFRPDEKITRGEIATYLSKLLEVPEATVLDLVDINIDDKMSRAEAIALLLNTFNIPINPFLEPQFADVTMENLYYHEIYTFNKLLLLTDIFETEDKLFRPAMSITRAEFIALLNTVRFIEINNDEELAQQAPIDQSNMDDGF